MEYGKTDHGPEMWPVDSEAAAHELITIAGNTGLPDHIRMIAYCVHSLLLAMTEGPH